MILALDTYYYSDKAKTAAIAFRDWADEAPAQVWSEITAVTADYEPGAFYKRELPCLLSLLAKIDLLAVSCIIIDGFAILDNDGNYGLGGRLYESLGAKIPVIGVAKTDFLRNTKNKCTLLRGKSNNPLFITAVGLSPDEAAEKISRMHGSFRLPTLLKRLDQLTKEI